MATKNCCNNNNCYSLGCTSRSETATSLLMLLQPRPLLLLQMFQPPIICLIELYGIPYMIFYLVYTGIDI